MARGSTLSAMSFMSVWPLPDLRLRCREVQLRPATESDLPHLAAILPDDYEHDPRAELAPWLSLGENRQRLICQQYWRSLGTWSPSSWLLDFVVSYDGAVVGVQTLEGDRFPTLRTVDSGSWLVASVRGRGVGVAMRMAVLGLAFDHLDAVAAVSSARFDNQASLGVSRRIGYADNGASLAATPTGLVELVHLRLTADAWRTAGHGREVTVDGAESCRPWFGAQ
jgi:RimJ/RimL family protein N-acetyltransferase